MLTWLVVLAVVALGLSGGIVLYREKYGEKHGRSEEYKKAFLSLVGILATFLAIGLGLVAMLAAGPCV